MIEPNYTAEDRVRPFLGQTFNMWTINKFIEVRKTTTTKNRSYAVIVMATCECGRSKEVQFSNIKSGRSKNCGCVGRSKTIARSTKHGFATRKGWTKEHKIWCGMIQRCKQEDVSHSKYYIDAGVSVCERWLDFKNFIADMGKCPPDKKSIDRFPNKRGNYEPNNCRWADDFEQSRNRVNNINVTVSGVVMTAREAEKLLGLPKDRIQSRVRRGYTEEEAFNMPVHHYRKSKRVNMDFTIVTIATHRPVEWYYTYDQFFKSCGDNKPLVLGRDFFPYSGLGSKVKMVHKAIKEGLVKSKYILFCDCFDMFFADNPSELIRKYRLFHDGYIVFSSERNCFPADLKSEYDKIETNSSFKYLNSGMIVGETAKFFNVLEAMDIPNIPEDHYDYDKNCMNHINDQYLYQQIFLKQPEKMILDYNQRLCQTLHQTTVEDFDFSKSRIMNKETKSTPMLYHANGSAKDSGVKEPILKHLNLL